MSCAQEHLVKVKLTDKEIERVREIAGIRDKNKKRFSSTRHWTKDESTHFIGLLGEMAFAKYTGLDLDDNNYRYKGDGGIDFSSKVTCQIKTTNYNNPALLCFYDHLNDFSADYAVLAYRESNNVIWLCGWVSRETFETESYIRNFGYGDRLVMRDIDLEPMWVNSA